MYDDRMRRLAPTATAAALITIALTGCGASAGSPPAPTSAATSASSDRAEVAWEDYPPSAQQLIDDAQVAGDCGALQDSFDVADVAGFIDQMRYIDEALDLAGCYE